MRQAAKARESRPGGHAKRQAAASAGFRSSSGSRPCIARASSMGRAKAQIGTACKSLRSGRLRARRGWRPCVEKIEAMGFDQAGAPLPGTCAQAVDQALRRVTERRLEIHIAYQVGLTASERSPVSIAGIHAAGLARAIAAGGTTPGVMTTSTPACAQAASTASFQTKVVATATRGALPNMAWKAGRFGRDGLLDCVRRQRSATASWTHRPSGFAEATAGLRLQRAPRRSASRARWDRSARRPSVPGPVVALAMQLRHEDAYGRMPACMAARMVSKRGSVERQRVIFGAAGRGDAGAVRHLQHSRPASSPPAGRCGRGAAPGCRPVGSVRQLVPADQRPSRRFRGSAPGGGIRVRASARRGDGQRRAGGGPEEEDGGESKGEHVMKWFP